MADIFLIIVSVVTFCILCIIGLYLIVYYQHPDDHNESYAPKLVVLLGFVIAGCTVLLLPLDVANNEGYPGTLYHALRQFALTFSSFVCALVSCYLFRFVLFV